MRAVVCMVATVVVLASSMSPGVARGTMITPTPTQKYER